LFTVDPDIRFSKQYKVPKGVWRDMWGKYKLMEYPEEDLRGLFFMKTGRFASKDMFRRWKWRTEVYSMAKPLIEKGTQAVNSYYFKEYEERLLKELLKNASATQKTKIII
jgi:hypothetical protein